MKRVLVVGDFISGSGLTQVIYNVFKHFPISGYQIEAVAYGKDPTDFTDKQCAKLGWKLYRVVPVTNKPIIHWKWWRNFFKVHHYDIVYFNYSSSWNYLPLVYARKYGHSGKIVCHSHNSYYSHVFSNPIMMKALNVLNNHGKTVFNKNADVKIATSIQAGKWMFGDNANNVHVVTNGMDLAKFAFSKEQRFIIRHKLDLSEDDQLIGFVGVLQERKNPLFALDVFHEYHKKYPNSKFVMLGKGPLKQELHKKISLYKLDQCVIQKDFVPDIYYWYSAMDALLFTSKYEGFGLVALEAQISKLPVFASNTNITKIFATDYIFKMNDLNAKHWSDRLDRTLSIGIYDRRGIDPALREFSIDRQAKTIQRLIN
ncbi:glycosyltransferase [Limosilactobacillus frumenti DSM 13145]|uniref:Glycosyltransferase n=1 Tax=Limosilactobacillus frumenti DSM 13145 TaxID=1423746 RepID=A0A0R1PD30_9LACO|nr:glycosyltransferase [Limosilactobacillus frumenti]KRL26184.1 glycosyltransferase [Limosilactobacillus frumenti DSM 13145]QFG72958.1 glycosyltransferase family 1 protein [Limosilactobacillus frumenti]